MRPTAPLLAWLALATACAAPARQPAPAVGLPEAGGPLSPARTARLRAYVKGAWATLTRTSRDLPRAAVDPKAPHRPGAPWPVYVAPDEDRARIAAALDAALPP